MFKTNELIIRMTEGDFGIILPIELETENEETFDDNDFFVMKIYERLNGEPIVTKTYQYSELEDDTIPFTLTEQETALLKVGTYLYDIDWYQNNEFNCCIVENEEYIITEKAGGVNESNN